MSTIKDNISHEQIMTAVMKTVAFAEKTIAPIFKGEMDNDSRLSCVCATFATVIENLVDGTVKINLDKKGDVDDEAKKPATEEAKPTVKREKQKPEEKEPDFLERVCKEVGDELLESLEKFGLTNRQAKIAMGILTISLIQAFDIESEVISRLISIQLGK